MQLPGLLGFPRGEEQAPGEQVELREEKGAKSESSPSLGLPYRSQWDASSHQHSSKTNEHLSGIECVLCSFSELAYPAYTCLDP